MTLNKLISELLRFRAKHPEMAEDKVTFCGTEWIAQTYIRGIRVNEDGEPELYDNYALEEEAR